MLDQFTEKILVGLILDRIGAEILLPRITHLVATIEGFTNEACAGENNGSISAFDETNGSGLVHSLGKWAHNFTHGWNNSIRPGDNQARSEVHTSYISHVEYCPENLRQANVE